MAWQWTETSFTLLRIPMKKTRLAKLILAWTVMVNWMTHSASMTKKTTSIAKETMTKTRLLGRWPIKC